MIPPASTTRPSAPAKTGWVDDQAVVSTLPANFAAHEFRCVVLTSQRIGRSASPDSVWFSRYHAHGLLGSIHVCDRRARSGRGQVDQAGVAE